MMGGKNTLGRATLLATLVATGAVAQRNESNQVDYVPTLAPGKSNTQDPGTEAYKLFDNAEPNATRSIDFDGSSWFSPESSLEGVKKWTWRVTVSDFAVPNARARFPDELGPLVDPHVVNTVHELEWEGDEDLSEALGGTDGRFCLAYLDATFPARVLNKVTSDSADSSDCGVALGDKCVEAIKKDGRIHPACNGIKKAWFSLEACADSVGSVIRPGTITTSTLAGRNDSRNSTDDDSDDDDDDDNTFHESGDGFLSHSSAAYNSSDPETYYNATNRLQVVMLQANHAGSNSNPKLFCMRVNTTEVPESEDEAAEGSEGSEGDGEGDGENMSFNMRASLGATFTVAFAAAAGLALL